MSDIDMFISMNIKNYRVRKGLTIKKLAEELNIPFSTCYSYEQFGRPPVRDLVKLSEIFGITLDDFIKTPLEYIEPRKFSFVADLYEFEGEPNINCPISMALGKECSSLYINTTLIDPRPKKKSKWYFKMFEMVD